ncbi:hypothetical protein GMLC_40310 [Geomonas limicola]|uniref:Sel1 repeat family protein n=1 Tax=Geomonas limicola TaxID=2740186 RepID=A0A6V8NCT9_9BACT|nr:tetratricopeptide repeat protein [Geomonas limicola]GFO70452.1 hypothetical protein GMLC_40310 [Geomonas limicola]
MKKYLIGSCLCVALLAAGSRPVLADYEAGLRAYKQGDYTRAFQEFSSDGSASSQFILSLMYQKGDGTRQDRKASLALLRSAAEKGLDVAQASLGLIYLEGAGVKADEKTGLEWLAKAAAQGLAEAQSALEMAGLEHPTLIGTQLASK